MLYHVLMVKPIRKVNVYSLSLLTLFLSLLYPQNSYAATCMIKSKVNGKEVMKEVTTLFDWQCSGDNTILSLVATFLNWMAAGVAAAVLIGIVYGAIIYATAAGDESKAKHGIEIIRNAVIALVLYALMWSFLQFLIPGGLFSASP